VRARFAELDRLAPAKTLPQPWRQADRVAVGGLTDVGIADSADLLLVVSQAGRGVLDCRTSALVARDDAGDFPFDVASLLAEGIGPLAGRTIRMSGLRGGGLAAQTIDGWGLEHHPLSWPHDEFFLAPTGQTMFWQAPDQPLKLTKLAGFIAEIRAFGFSPTGRTFIIATAADISVFVR
jgi:hypothetical protein